MAKYNWDELDDHVARVKEHYSQRKDIPDDEKAGWEHRETHPNGTRIYATDRHYAAETEAHNKKEARTKMQQALGDHDVKTRRADFAWR